MSYYYSQILLTLLSMEFLILRVLLILRYNLYVYKMLYLLIYYLVFVVCESVLGLTLLICLIRTNGNDNINLLNLILW